jgi:hypothetical protein
MRSLALAPTAALGLAAAGPAHARVPHAVAGTVADGALFDEAGVLDPELDAMVGAGGGRAQRARANRCS